MILNFVKLYEDETLYSFLRRIADANGVTLSDIEKYFGMRQNALSHENVTILRLIHYPIALDELLMKHTLFPLIAPLNSEVFQVEWINMFQYDLNKYKSMVPIIKTRNNDTNICPLCMKEDVEKKRGIIFRRSHQAPGVTVCWKHGVKLIKFGEESNRKAESATSEFEIIYAKLCHDILDMDLKCNDLEIDLLLKENIKEKFNNAKELTLFLEKKCIPKEILKDDIEKIADQILKVRTDIGVQKILVLIATLSSTNQLIERFGEEKDSIFPLNGYRVIKKYGLFSVVEHKCGERFITSEYGFKAGWRCIKCDPCSNDEEKFQQVVQNINPDWKLCSKFNGMSKYVAIEHKCGKQDKVRARFILTERTCECEKGPTAKEIRELAESNGFKCLSFKRSTSIATTLLELKHNECGHIIFRTMSGFKRRPRCPICRNKGFYVEALELNIKSTDDLKKAVADLTGNDYTVLSELPESRSGLEPIKFKCNKCNKITLMPARAFLLGRRCNCEMNPNGEDELKSFVRMASNGKYEVIKQKGKYSYKIADNTGNIIADGLSRQFILGELRRPTQSKIIPLPNDVRANVKNVMIGILPYIRETIANSPESDWTAEKLSNEFYSSYEISMKLSFLSRRGELYRVGEGIYHAINDPNFDNRRIVPEKSFQIRDFIWMLIKDREELYTISEISDLTGYSVVQTGTALNVLEINGYIHRIATGTYINGKGESFVNVPDQVLNYIKKNLNDRPFTIADIKIPGLTREQIGDALKKFPKKGFAKRIKTGVYVFTGVDQLENKKGAVQKQILEIINKDIKADYRIKDFECLNKPKNQISGTLGRLVKKGILIKVKKGVFHSAADKDYCDEVQEE